VNVVLLHTGRPMRVDQVAEARHQLRTDATDRLAVVSWHRPATVLPIDHHVLVRTVGGSRPLPVLDAEPDVEPAELEDDASTGLALGPGGPEEESAATFEDDDAPPQAAPRSTAAKLRPASVAHALRWRANRARLTVRRHPTIVRVIGSTKLRRARKAVIPDTLASRYAAACLASREVNELVAQADVVVAMDAHTHRAAWLLARRHPGPDVVVGLAAAQRSLAARAEESAEQSS
jgi:hypothetical protein